MRRLGSKASFAVGRRRRRGSLALSPRKHPTVAAIERWKVGRDRTRPHDQRRHGKASEQIGTHYDEKHQVVDHENAVRERDCAAPRPDRRGQKRMRGGRGGRETPRSLQQRNVVRR